MKDVKSGEEKKKKEKECYEKSKRRQIPSGLTSNSVAEGGVSKGEGSAERELKLKCPREMKVKLWTVNGMRTRREVLKH